MSNFNYKDQIVKCPHCGREYLLGEIYTDRAFTGRPTDIVRDALGKIIYANYVVEPDYHETYICDGCSKQFVVDAEVSLKSNKEAVELDFTEPAVSLID